MLNILYNSCTFVPKAITTILKLVGQRRISEILKSTIKPDVGKI